MGALTRQPDRIRTPDPGRRRRDRNHRAGLGRASGIAAFGLTRQPGRRCLECLGQYQSELVSLERDGWLDDPSYIKGLSDNHPLKRRENVFGFSNMAASLEIMQMLSMVIAPSRMGNVAAQLYHFVDGSLDKENERRCNASCFFSTVIARGDRAGVSCTSRHRLAEEARASRAITPQHEPPRGGWRQRFRSLWPFGKS